MEKSIAVRNIDDVERLARIAITSGYTACRKPEEAAMLILTGVELGLSPMLALRGIYVVSGKPVLSADLMVAVVRRSGQCESWRVVESTTDRCTITTRRRGEAHDATRTWTMVDAKRAGVTGKSVWTQYPAAMLRHRCAADLAREVYPDVLMGLYDPEEMGAEPEVEAERPAVVAVAEPVQLAALGIEAQAPRREPLSEAVRDRAEAIAGTDPSAGEWRQAVETAERDLVAEIRESASVRHTVRELADLWRGSRAELKAAKLERAAWDVIVARALELKIIPKAVTAEVKRLDTEGDGPKGGTPKPTAPATTDATGTGQDTAPAQGAQALALVPAWAGSFEEMEHHIAGMSCSRHIENAARKYRSGLPATARELLAARLQRLSWDPHDGEITIESARELVARWIAAGPVERVRPAARAKLAAGGVR